MLNVLIQDVVDGLYELAEHVANLCHLHDHAIVSLANHSLDLLPIIFTLLAEF